MAGLWGAITALGGVGGLYAILTPVRRAWRARQVDNLEHKLDHKGRPARIDPSTGETIADAQPGLASAMVEVRIRTGRIETDVADIKRHLVSSTDNTAAINEIRDMLRQQDEKNDRKHSENRLAVAESRAEVAKLETAMQRIGLQAEEAAVQARGAADQAKRLEQEQQERWSHLESEFAHHKTVEQAYRTAIIDMGVPVEVPAE